MCTENNIKNLGLEAAGVKRRVRHESPFCLYSACVMLRTISFSSNRCRVRPKDPAH
eukprot:jgi/Antlo1/1599/461